MVAFYTFFITIFHFYNVRDFMTVFRVTASFCQRPVLTLHIPHCV